MSPKSDIGDEMAARHRAMAAERQTRQRIRDATGATSVTIDLPRQAVEWGIETGQLGVEHAETKSGLAGFVLAIISERIILSRCDFATPAIGPGISDWRHCGFRWKCFSQLGLNDRCAGFACARSE